MNYFSSQWFQRCRQHNQKSRENTSNNRPHSNSNVNYLKIPYVNDRMDEALRRIFKRHGFEVRIVHQSTQLSNLVKPKHKRNTAKCSMRACDINNDAICHSRNVVYHITCRGCGAHYVGSTTRPLHIRIQEHLRNTRNNNSSIHIHKATCNNPFDSEILTRENDKTLLRIKEAYFIRKLSPNLNRKEEIDFAKVHIFS